MPSIFVACPACALSFSFCICTQMKVFFCLTDRVGTLWVFLNAHLAEIHCSKYFVVVDVVWWVCDGHRSIARQSTQRDLLDLRLMMPIRRVLFTNLHTNWSCLLWYFIYKLDKLQNLCLQKPHKRLLFCSIFESSEKIIKLKPIWFWSN